MSHWESYKYKEVVRDSQQRREYRAEWDFAKEFADTWMSNPAMLKFLRMVAEDQWFRDRFGTVVFAVTFNKRRRFRATCSRGTTGFVLKFPGAGNMNYRITALHELMHVVCRRQQHGPIFCSALLQVVTHYMGAVAGRELQRQFRTKLVELVR